MSETDRPTLHGMPTMIRPIQGARQAARNWIVLLDDQPVHAVRSLTVHHPHYGVLAYGETPAGHDGWSFRETGGGGVVVLPFVPRANDLYVGLLRQHRHNQGGDVWNAPRGFVEPGEDHLAAGHRELGEETGIDARLHRLFLLAGSPGNPNSAFFETPEASLGVRFVAVEFSPGDLTEVDGTLQLREALVSSNPEARSHRTAEQISAARFFHWTEAARVADMFTNAAVARLLAYLHEKRRYGAAEGK